MWIRKRASIHYLAGASSFGSGMVMTDTSPPFDFAAREKTEDQLLKTATISTTSLRLQPTSYSQTTAPWT